jgi:mono/diheme cytochrome c family protein
MIAMSYMRAVLAVAAMVMLPVQVAAQEKTDSTSAAVVARGKEIFAGKVGGALCFTCHGPGAKGVPGLGPDLTDDKWLHGDGGFAFLQAIVKTGVMKPKQSSAVMPPMGGASLSAEQLGALAAYLKTLE